MSSLEQVDPPPDTQPDPPAPQQQQATESVSEPEGEDFSASSSTPGQVVVGDEGGASGNICDADDEDGFKVALEAGKRYRVDVLTDGYHDVSYGGTMAVKPTIEVLALNAGISSNIARLNSHGDRVIPPDLDSPGYATNQGSGPDNGARTEFDGGLSSSVKRAMARRGLPELVCLLGLLDLQESTQRLADDLTGRRAVGLSPSSDRGSQFRVDAHGHHFSRTRAHGGPASAAPAQRRDVVVAGLDLFGDGVEIGVCEDAARCGLSCSHGEPPRVGRSA